jgi:hypothetical protein
MAIQSDGPGRARIAAAQVMEQSLEELLVEASSAFLYSIHGDFVEERKGLIKSLLGDGKKSIEWPSSESST